MKRRNTRNLDKLVELSGNVFRQAVGQWQEDITLPEGWKSRISDGKMRSEKQFFLSPASSPPGGWPSSLWLKEALEFWRWTRCGVCWSMKAGRWKQVCARAGIAGRETSRGHMEAKVVREQFSSA